MYVCVYKGIHRLDDKKQDQRNWRDNWINRRGCQQVYVITLWLYIYFESSVDSSPFSPSAVSPHPKAESSRDQSPLINVQAPCSHKSQRSIEDLKTLFSIMHMEHTFINPRSQYMALVLCWLGSAFWFYLTHGAFKIMSNDKHEKEKREEEMKEREQTIGHLWGANGNTLLVFVLCCSFHYFWVHRRFWFQLEERKSERKVAQPRGGCWFKQRTKRILAFDVKTKTDHFAALRLSGNSSLIGVVISVEVRVKGKIRLELRFK